MAQRPRRTGSRRPAGRVGDRKTRAKVTAKCSQPGWRTKRPPPLPRAAPDPPRPADGAAEGGGEPSSRPALAVPSARLRSGIAVGGRRRTTLEYRKFGKSDLRVSAIGFGCWEIGGQHYGGADDTQLTLVVICPRARGRRVRFTYPRRNR